MGAARAPYGPPPPASTELRRPLRRASPLPRPSRSAATSSRRSSARSGRSSRFTSRRSRRSSHGDWPKTDIDRFVLARLEKEGLTPVRAGRQADADPPRDTRSDRPAADARGDRRVREGRRRPMRSRRWSTGCWRRRSTAKRGAASGSTSRATARTTTARSIRRAAGYNPYPERLSVSRLGDQGVQRRHAVRPVRAGAARRRSDRRRRRARGRCRRSGFLGLGPWYYDNGAVEITRADERHDRVDVVSRGFLGLTVGCARCHDHKYDPIPTTDYYSLAGVFLNTAYHEYPLAPKSVVDEYNEQDKKIEKKEKLLEEFMRTESTQLSRDAGAAGVATTWPRRGGSPASRKKRSSKVVDDEKLDYELFDRWLKFLAKPPQVLSVPDEVAGDDQERRQRRPRRRRSPTNSRRCSST